MSAFDMIGSLKDVLGCFDSDGDGMLTKDEISDLEQTLEYVFSPTERSMFLDNELTPYDSIISAIMFIDNNQDLKSAFESFDEDKNGTLLVPELINIVKGTPQFSTVEDINELLLKIPRDDDNIVYDSINM